MWFWLSLQQMLFFYLTRLNTKYQLIKFFRDFELNSKLGNESHEHQKYDLIGMIVHVGSLDRGIYDARALNQNSGKWLDSMFFEVCPLGQLKTEEGSSEKHICWRFGTYSVACDSICQITLHTIYFCICIKKVVQVQVLRYIRLGSKWFLWWHRRAIHVGEWTLNVCLHIMLRYSLSLWLKKIVNISHAVAKVFSCIICSFFTVCFRIIDFVHYWLFSESI